MFRFKEFTIEQDRCPMKVGTDGVLLGAWAGVTADDARILDVGTGTGLIALMLAQRSEGQVTGVDIDDVEQAQQNAAASPWAARVTMVQCAVQDFDAEPFDLILSNPPYFADSLICPDAGRTTARHAVRLTFEELCQAVLRLLHVRGRFAMILPASEVGRFLTVSAGALYLTRRMDVRTRPCGEVKRVLLEFQRSSATLVYSELIIGTGLHEEYTPQYRALTRDFYLKF